MRNISFSLTTPQFIRGTKDVTRRLGWRFARVGDTYRAVEKGQGLKRGEKIKVLGFVQILRVSFPALDSITRHDVVREGFPTMSSAEFVAFFCKANKCDPDTIVTRLEFKKIEPLDMHPCAGMSQKEIDTFEQIASGNALPPASKNTFLRLLKAGVIEAAPDRKLRDGFGKYSIPQYRVPTAVNLRWCNWCSKSNAGDIDV